MKRAASIDSAQSREQAAAIAEARDAVEDVIEPYLIQQGYLERTPRGRMATPLAYQRFGLTPPPGAQASIFG